MAAISTADRIASLPANGSVPNLVPEMPNSTIAKSSDKALLDAGVPMSTIEVLTDADLKEIARIAKNEYVRNWNKKRKIAKLAAEAEALQISVALQSESTPIYAPVLISEQKPKQVKTMTKELNALEARTVGIENGMNAILAKLNAMNMHQTPPQVFAPVAPVAAPAPQITLAPTAPTVKSKVRSWLDKKTNTTIISPVFSFRGFPSDQVYFEKTAGIFTGALIRELKHAKDANPSQFAADIDNMYAIAYPYLQNK
jgi:hypothetical protein